MITFWCSCDDELFSSVVQKTLKSIRPGIKYKKVPIEGHLYRPKEGEVVVAMGGKAHALLKKARFCPRNLALTTIRERVLSNNLALDDEGERTGEDDKFQGCYLVTPDPGSILFNHKNKSLIEWDIRLAERLDRTGSLDPELKNCQYEYVQDFSETIQYIKDKYEATGKSVDVALDTETMGFYPWYKDKKIVCIQISVEERQAQVYYALGAKNRNLITKQLEWILNTDKASLKGANLKFDLIWIRRKYGVTCSNFKMDTLIVGSLINENRSNSLSNHAKEYTSIGGYDREMDAKYDKGHMERIPKKDLLVYSAGDTDATLRVSNKQRKELKQRKNLQHFYVKILHRAARAFEDIEYHGVLYDKKRGAEVRKIVQKEIDRCTETLVGMMPRRLRAKHSHRPDLLTPSVLREFLFTPYGLNLTPQMKTAKTGKASTAYDHLMMFLDHPEVGKFIKTYKELTSARKTIQTYIDGFEQHLRPDGKFHPTYMLYTGSMYGGSKEGGTVTGRTSTKDPALQTLTKRNKWAKLLRSCYPSPEGYVFFQCLGGDTLVSLTQGVKKIKDVTTKDKVLVDGESYPISFSGKTGFKDLYTITTSSGKTLEATLDHRVHVCRGGHFKWVEVRDLKSTDYLLSQDYNPEFKGLDRTAYVLGLFSGDGHFTEGEYYTKHRTKKGVKKYKFKGQTLGFSLGGDVDELLPYIEKEFSAKFSVSSSGDASLSNRIKYSKWLKLHGYKKSSHVGVPTYVKEGGDSTVLSYLKGVIDSDGSAHSRRVTITSICEGFIKELQLLASRVGIFGVINKKKQITNFSKGVPLISFNLDFFELESLKKIPLVGLQRKSEIIRSMYDKTYSQCRCALIPAEALTRFNKKRVQSKPEANRLFSNSRRNGVCTRDSLRKAIKAEPKLKPAEALLKYRYNKVESVEFCKKAEVYDITVPGAHKFYANGLLVHNCDYSQGELRIAACIANEKTMIRAYNRGADLHALTGSSLGGYTYEDFMNMKTENPALFGEYRSKAKASNFGLLYGMQAKGYREYARTSYDLSLSLQEAEAQRDTFFATYPGLTAWHNRSINIAHRNKGITSPLGRVRHLPHIDSKSWKVRSQAERQAINSPVQSTLSDLCLWSIAEIHERYPMEEVWLAGMTHDSIYGYIKEDVALERLREMKQIMENLPLEKQFGWKPQIPFLVDVEASETTLAKLEEVNV